MTSGINTTHMRMDRMAGFCIYGSFVEITNLQQCRFNLAASIDSISWTDLTGSTATVLSTMDYMWNISQPFYNYVRIESTLTGGSLLANIKGRAIKI